MFPIMLDVSHLPIILIGQGEALIKRLQKLDLCEARKVWVFSPFPDLALQKMAEGRLQIGMPKDEEIKKAAAVMIVGLAEEEMIRLAKHVRSLHTLVNVEDKREWCDFHFPSFVKRGDLLLTVSTNGKSPTLAMKIRHWLEKRFMSDWAVRLDQLEKKRQEWKAIPGASNESVRKQSERYIEAEGWLE